jgi:AraC-like DNA-binding protein
MARIAQREARSTAIYSTDFMRILGFDWRKEPILQQTLFSRKNMLASQMPFEVYTHTVLSTKPDNIHWHDALEIGYIIEGEGISVVEGVEFPFTPGQIHIRNGSDRHMDYAYDKALIFNVHLHPELLHDPNFVAIDSIAHKPFTHSEKRLRSFIEPNEPYAPDVIRALNQIRAEADRQAFGWELVVKGLLLQIVGHSVRHFAEQDPDFATINRRREMLVRLSPALEMLESNLQVPYSLQELSNSVVMSPAYFCTIFKEIVGVTPIAYRNARRIRNARFLLSDSRLSVAEIAEQCGFESQRQFNRLFLRLVRMTPSQYRATTR